MNNFLLTYQYDDHVTFQWFESEEELVNKVKELNEDKKFVRVLESMEILSDRLIELP